MPALHAPPLRISPIRPPSSFSTAVADVGEMQPKRLALGAAIGVFISQQTARITGCSLRRTATVGCPLVTRSGIIAFFGKTKVSGPGQNSEINF